MHGRSNLSVWRSTVPLTEVKGREGDGEMEARAVSDEAQEDAEFGV